MKPLYLLTAAVLVSVISSLTCYTVYYTSQAESSNLITFKKSSNFSKRPSFSLPDLQGQRHVNSEWDDKVVVVNFWATWCPPCLNEIPRFVELQEEYGARGLQFVGVAIDEVAPVQRVAKTLGINYPVLVGNKEAIAVATQFGNNSGVLPFTVVINRQGYTVWRQPGEIEEAEVKQIILSLLK